MQWVFVKALLIGGLFFAIKLNYLNVSYDLLRFQMMQIVYHIFVRL